MKLNTFIPLYFNLTNHPKLLRLCCILGKTTEDEKLILRAKVENLWIWVMQYFPEGEIRDITPEIIAQACCWNDDPIIWINALIQSGFLTQTEHGYCIPNWDQYGGKTILKKKQDTERKRRSRAASESNFVDDPNPFQSNSFHPESEVLPLGVWASPPAFNLSNSINLKSEAKTLSTGHPRDKFLLSLIILQLGICHFMFAYANKHRFLKTKGMILTTYLYMKY
jgi:hypothetical protein